MDENQQQVINQALDAFLNNESVQAQLGEARSVLENAQQEVERLTVDDTNTSAAKTAAFDQVISTFGIQNEVIIVRKNNIQFIVWFRDNAPLVIRRVMPIDLI